MTPHQGFVTVSLIYVLFRCIFLQVLVLGFEFNTEAERLVTNGELHLLDVITSLNKKEINAKAFVEKTYKAGFCDLIVKRSISFPSLDPLLKNGIVATSI